MARAKYVHVEWDGWFSFEIPKEWKSTEDEGVVTLFDEKKGVGVIQVSVARRNREVPLEEDAREFSASHLSAALRDRSDPVITTGDCGARGAVSYVDSDGDYWRIWVIVSKSRIATISYNCEETVKSAEADKVNRVVDSFSWLPPSSAR